MKNLGTRAITVLVVALLLVCALRYTPRVTARPPAMVLRSAESILADTTPVAPPPPAPAPTLSRVEQLNRGETLIGLLKRVGVSEVSAREVLRAATASAVNTRYLRAGMRLEVTSDSAGVPPRELVFHLGVDRLLRVVHSDSGWIGTEERLPWTTDTVVVAGTIRSTLYQAIEASASEHFPGRAKDELTWALADIFEYRFDMSRDLQQGDRMRVLVERSVAPNGRTKMSKVLAASFTLSGTEVSAFRFDSKFGRPSYYDAKGKSLRAQFLRAPLEFRRVSSTFGMRFHPILGRYKAHRGTDYAASSGTPVRAVGDAQVVRAGWAGGYGNVLELRHRNGYVTRYGHLRGFAKGIRAGQRVEIGQTVAYVGSTGLSTAPHLHFEVLVGGVQRDSRSALRSVAGEPIGGSERRTFERVREQMLASLDATPGVVRLALR